MNEHRNSAGRALTRRATYSVLLALSLPAFLLGAPAAEAPVADAAERGDRAAVRALLSQGADVNDDLVSLTGTIDVGTLASFPATFSSGTTGLATAGSPTHNMVWEAQSDLAANGFPGPVTTDIVVTVVLNDGFQYGSPVSTNAFTFGNELEAHYSCPSCGEHLEVTENLDELPVKSLGPDEQLEDVKVELEDGYDFWPEP